MNMEQYDASAAVPGTKRSLLLLADIGPEQPLDFTVLRIDGVRRGPTLLVLAGVHGDEYEGVETVLRLYRDLQPEQLTGSVILVPRANPLSYRSGTRTSPEDGVNMARAFPGNPDGTPTERLAWHLHHRFIAHADFMLDLHSGGTHYAVATLVGYYDDESTDIGRKSRAAAEAFGIELLWAHDTVAPGRTVSSALALGVPWLYTEAYGGRRIRREDAEAFYAGALRLMRHLGMLGPDATGRKGEGPEEDGVKEDRVKEDGVKEDKGSGAVERAVDGRSSTAEPSAAEARANAGNAPCGSRNLQRIYGDGNFDGSETAEADGFFIPALPLGSPVAAGGRIGTICGFGGEELQQVVSSRAGRVVMLPGTPAVRRGEPLYLVAPTER